MTINKKLLPMKAYFFLLTIAIGPILTYMTIIARQKGFSPSVIGLMLTSFHIAATAAKPVFCWIADSFRLRKFMFILMQGVTGLTFFGIYFIPSIQNEVQVHRSHNWTEVFFCPKDPIWDKCLDLRIESHESKTFKCEMSCSSNASKRHAEFAYEIALDMSSLVRNSSCIIVREWDGNSSAESSKYFSNAMTPIDCDVRCEDDFFRGTLADRGFIPDDRIHEHSEFWTLFFLLLGGYIAKSIVYSIGDTICFDLLDDKPHLYGHQLVWDSIASGINSVVVGAVIDAMSGESVFKDYTVVYFTCLAAVIINMIWSSRIQYNQPKKNESILKDMSQLFKSIRYVTFFVWCSLMGLFAAVVFSFLFLHLEELSDKIGQDDCGKSYIKTLEGVVIFIQCIVSNIPILFLSGYIIKKLGHINCMHLGLAGFAVKCFYYSQLTNPWWVLPVEVLDGLTYGLMGSVFVSYASLIAPKGAEATTQGLVGALFEGLGMALATFVTGNLFEEIGSHKTFLVFGYLALGCLIVHIAIHSTLDYYEKKSYKAVQKVETNLEI